MPTVFFFLLENQNFLKNHFFSVLTFGLKKEDMGLMPVLSTFARLFWAVVIFLAGWNKEIQIYIKTLGRNVLNVQAEQKNGLSIRVDMTLKRIGESLFTKYLPEGERKQIHFFSTHFSCKVCTVEFGVILSSLHWIVWKFPLLANKVIIMS